jgi:hypothetical protein
VEEAIAVASLSTIPLGSRSHGSATSIRDGSDAPMGTDGVVRVFVGSGPRRDRPLRPVS